MIWRNRPVIGGEGSPGGVALRDYESHSARGVRCRSSTATQPWSSPRPPCPAGPTPDSPYRRRTSSSVRRRPHPHPTGFEEVWFGTGCFWGTEEIFWQQPGVYTTAVGYAGGYTPEPVVRGGLHRPHRSHRGRPGRLRPDQDHLHRPAEGLLGNPRPDPGHAPGQRPRLAVPLGDLLHHRRPARRGRTHPRPLRPRHQAPRLRRHHHRDRPRHHVLLRRGLPPAVPRTRTPTATAATATPGLPFPG